MPPRPDTLRETRLPDEIRRDLDPMGLATALDSHLAGGDEFIESERRNRRGALFRLRNLRPENQEQFEALHNQEGIRHQERAIAEIQRARERLDDDATRQLDDAMRSTQFKERLDSARARLLEELTNLDAQIEDVEEVIRLWDQAAAARENGVKALLRDTESHAERVRDLRSGPDRGRQPHSPLAEWKYQWLWGLLGITILSIILCYFYFGCVWIVYLIIAVGAWAYTMLIRGC